MNQLLVRLIVVLAIVIAPFTVRAQTARPAKNTAAVNAVIQSIKNSGAYNELLLRRTETAIEIRLLLVDLNDEAPELRRKRRELDLLERELTRLESLPVGKTDKLTALLGRLLVRQIEAEVELAFAGERYAADSTQVKRAIARVQAYREETNKLLD